MGQRWTRNMNRISARTARAARGATTFVSQPEPRTIGSFAKGRQLVAGNFLFAGYLVESPGAMIWDLPAPDSAYVSTIHGFTWLDDLAAVGDLAAREQAQDFTFEWIARYGTGKGPGWTPDLTGRRLIRWINHAILLLNGRSSEESAAYFRSLSRQTNFLGKRWKAASPGLPRFEALTGLIYAGLALSGMDGTVGAAARALAKECSREIDASGGLLTRNPEDLLEVFMLLNWAADALSDAGRMPAREHLDAIARIAPVMRALRHADGGLARFHGGGRGMEGRLEQGLATSGIKPLPPEDIAMGYVRLAQARTTVIVDAAAPPLGPASAHAHASTLAFELTSGRRPMIVNCGSGATFGKSWRRAGRATASHSTLGIGGVSSSRLSVPTLNDSDQPEYLLEVPTEVTVAPHISDDRVGFQLGHNGYEATHGLAHVRRLELGRDGRVLEGEDALTAIGQDGERRFDLAFHKSNGRGIPFASRFHLHPDVDAHLDMGGSAVSLVLKSGEIWVFRYSGPARLSLEPSVYLERTRLSPRATRQIVLTATALDYATRLGWTFSKAQDTPSFVRDFSVEEPMVAH
ncbi:MAG: heparinase II/III family protein [Rhodobacteraceae bacterium]|nr:heparinase II/III family protein [Paracoccaceae bacterium]